MKPIVTVVDYGRGNLYSVSRALAYCGAEVIVTDSPELIAHAEYLVLPGVGAFGDGMQGLYERNQIEAIRQVVADGRPLLGICLGMQLLFEYSEEFGRHEGFSFIAGKVTAIPRQIENNKQRKIPHIGWNKLISPTQHYHTPLLHGLKPQDAVYFVHSFEVVPVYPEHCKAFCDYLGHPITAVVSKDNLYGCQFHPEKSGLVGLQLLKNFIAL